MISFAPLAAQVRKLLRQPLPDIAACAAEQWQVAPPETTSVPPAIFLPDQIERIRATEFAPIDVVIRSFRGGFAAQQAATTAYRLRDVDLVDGVLYAVGGQRHLRARRTRTPAYRTPREVTSGALYESWVGNRWFGNWLSDDCLAYRLADAAGRPITSVAAKGGHVPRYEALLGMAPTRVSHVHFDELILFDDHADNSGKRRRAAEVRRLLLAGQTPSPIPGVFLLRGTTGDQRLLQNEAAIAEHLAATRGFAVLDPATATVDAIAALCGQAAVVAGVEGSHLVHGLVMMPPGAALLVLQPPERTVAALKIVTDRQDQRYAFVVGDGNNDRFRVDLNMLDRTLDLLG